MSPCISSIKGRIANESSLQHVAEHDPLRGELSIPWADGLSNRDNHWKERFFVRGLAFIRQLETASTYADRCMLLDWESLHEDLSTWKGLMEQVARVSFRDYISEARDNVLNSSSAGDTDAGPKNGWLWAYEDSLFLDYKLFNGHKILREWGFVLWDSARWEQSGF